MAEGKKSKAWIWIIVIIILGIVLAIFWKKIFKKQGIAGADYGIAEGQLIKCADKREIYLYEGGKKRWFPNWDTFLSYGYTIGQVNSISCSVVDKIPTGENMPKK